MKRLESLAGNPALIAILATLVAVVATQDSAREPLLESLGTPLELSSGPALAARISSEPPATMEPAQELPLLGELTVTATTL